MEYSYKFFIINNYGPNISHDLLDNIFVMLIKICFFLLMYLVRCQPQNKKHSYMFTWIIIIIIIKVKYIYAMHIHYVPICIVYCVSVCRNTLSGIKISNLHTNLHKSIYTYIYVCYYNIQWIQIHLHLYLCM